MNTPYEKCAQQKRRHPPECPKQERIFLRIMMRRMSQIPGEFPRRPGMALLTGPNDIFSTQMRTRVCNRQNVMSTVTVIALRGLRVSELRHFAVIGIEIRFRDRFMTTTALLHDLQFETGFIRPTDGVRRVTIVAYRQWLVRLRHKHRMDASFKLLLDSMMAAAACLGKVFSVHTGQRIGLGQNTMWSVAVRARRCDREAALHEPLAMDAFRVVLDNFVLGTRVTRGRLLPFTVTIRTQPGDVRRKCRRVGAQLPENSMRSVTFLARGTVRIVLADEFSMYAHLILQTNLSVAGRAFYLLRYRFAWSQMRDAYFGMTLTARHLLMFRVSEYLGLYSQ